ncbi:hypothetical protein CoNPh17_CDS0133 [Staphylococcus phage S-CoN_Ph17]|nr:hypothetical protein CoNPh17_CDS0133 [Staphylococcus phage S-CoN_Ph17]
MILFLFLKIKGISQFYFVIHLTFLIGSCLYDCNTNVLFFYPIFE